MDDQQFSQKLKSQLRQTQTFVYREADWETIASQLDEQQDRPKVWLYWLFSFLLLALIGTIGFSFSSSNAENPDTSSTLSIEQKTQWTNHLTLDEEPTSSLTSKTIVSHPKTNSFTQTPITPVPQTQANPKRPTSAILQAKKSSPLTSNEASPTQAAPINKTIAKDAFANPKKRISPAHTPLPTLARQSASLPSGIKQYELPEASFVNQVFPIIKPIKPIRKNSPLSIGLRVGRGIVKPHFKYYEKQLAKSSQSIHFDLSWRLRNRIWLQLGAANQQLEQQLSLPTNELAQIPSADPPLSIDTQQKQWRYQLGLRLLPVKQHRWQVFIEPSLSFQHIHQGENTITVSQSTYITNYVIEIYQDDRLQFSGFQLGMGGSFRVVKNWWLEVGVDQPIYLKSPLDDLQNKFILQTGIRYQF